MDALCSYVDDPFLNFCWSTPTLSDLEQKIIWTIDRLSRITGRLSMAEIARAARASRRSVANVIQRFRGKGLTFVGEVGRIGIIRVDLGAIQAAGEPMHPEHKPVHDVPGSPMHAVHTPPAPTLPVLPERDFKSLKINLRVNHMEGVKAPPTPIFSEEEKKTISEAVRYYQELRGADTNQPPVVPGADLCFRILSAARLCGAEQSRYLLIAHFEETRQQKNRRFDSLHHAFPWVVRDGRKIWNELNVEWAEQRIERGRKIAEGRKSQKQEIERKRAEEAAVVPPERARQLIDQILGRTRKSAAL